MPTPLIPDIALFQRKLASFPVATYQAGDSVLAAGSRTGRLLRCASGHAAAPPSSVMKCPDRGHQRLNAHNVHHAGEIVGEYV
jgi:hypothetical protein